MLGNDFLQSGGLPAKILYLVTGRRPRRVTREPALPGLKELLRPDVIEALGNTFAAAQLGNAVLAAQAVQHDAYLVFS